MTKALTLLVALSIFCIKANTLTKVNNGTAISVKPKTPKAIFAILPIADIAVNAANNAVIAVANIINANTLGKTLLIFRLFININTPVNVNNGKAIAVKAKTPFAASLALTFNLLMINITPDIASNNKLNAPAEAIAPFGSVK